MEPCANLSVPSFCPPFAGLFTSMRWTTCPRRRPASCTAASCSLRSSRATARASRCLWVGGWVRGWMDVCLLLSHHENAV